MWRNPNHPAPAQQAAPEPSGHSLITFPRPGRNGAADAELRVSLDEYQGNKYISVRTWFRGADGGWWPTKKGCSIRISEAEEFCEALVKAVQMADFEPARLPQSAPAQRQQSRTTQRPSAYAATRASATAEAQPPRELAGKFDKGFDEFE